MALLLKGLSETALCAVHSALAQALLHEVLLVYHHYVCQSHLDVYAAAAVWVDEQAISQQNQKGTALTAPDEQVAHYCPGNLAYHLNG